MANRRAPQQKPQNVDKSEGDFDFPMSQQSNGSEEQQALMETLEKHYNAVQQGKKAQKEKKFLEISEKQLNLELKSSTKAIENATNDVDRLYAKFLVEYAMYDDRIHKKWTEIQEQQETLAKIIEERRKCDEEIIVTASSTHGSGLIKTKAACKAFQNTINRLIIQEQ